VSLPLRTTFTTIDWSAVSESEHPGTTGAAFWKTLQFGDVRVRLVRYTPEYLADHWCARGHVLHVLSGTLVTDLHDGRSVTLEAGMSYTVADHAMPHRSRTEGGALLFIVD